MEVYPACTPICVAQIQGRSWKKKKKKKNILKPEAKRGSNEFGVHGATQASKSCVWCDGIMPLQDKRLLGGEFPIDDADLAEDETLLLLLLAAVLAATQISLSQYFPTVVLLWPVA